MTESLKKKNAELKDIIIWLNKQA